MLHAKFKDHRTPDSGEDFFHVWEWWPSWSCDLDHLYIYKLSFPLPMDTHVKFDYESPSAFVDV